VVSRIRHRLSTSVVQAINVSSALIIVGFGVAAMITAG
jgi:hypothetical protein